VGSGDGWSMEEWGQNVGEGRWRGARRTSPVCGESVCTDREEFRWHAGGFACRVKRFRFDAADKVTQCTVSSSYLQNIVN